MATVRGKLELPPMSPDAAAAVRIIIEDVSRADAPARVVGEQTLHDVRLRGLRFEIQVPDIDPKAHYSVRVHADVAGTGMVSSGDLFTTQSVPVLTWGAPSEVTVPVTLLP